MQWKKLSAFYTVTICTIIMSASLIQHLKPSSAVYFLAKRSNWEGKALTTTGTYLYLNIVHSQCVRVSYWAECIYRQPTYSCCIPVYSLSVKFWTS